MPVTTASDAITACLRRAVAIAPFVPTVGSARGAADAPNAWRATIATTPVTASPARIAPAVLT